MHTMAAMQLESSRLPRMTNGLYDEIGDGKVKMTSAR